MTIGVIRWMRRVIPSGQAVAVVLIIEVLIECLDLLYHPRGRGRLIDDELFRGMRLAWLSGSAFFYGLFRVNAFHPAANRAYWRWLELTPWTPRLPLPVGPLQLVPQDLLVISFLCLLYRSPTLSTLYIPTSFLFGYQFVLANYASTLGHWKLAYLIRFGLGFVVLFLEHPEVAFAAADGCFLIGRIAVSHALKTFPWRIVDQSGSPTDREASEDATGGNLGWPYDQLSPRAPRIIVPLHHGICSSLLVGWWWFVGLSKLNDPGYRTTATIVAAVITIFTSMGVVGHYRAWHRSPINLTGRLFTFRLIIPSYDQIFVAPSIAAMTCLLTQIIAAILFHDSFGLWRVQNALPGIVVSSMGLTLSLMILFATGPRVEHWRLAAKHRIIVHTGQGDDMWDDE